MAGRRPHKRDAVLQLRQERRIRTRVEPSAAASVAPALGGAPSSPTNSCNDAAMRDAA
jgi:hypothetical protein